MEERESAERKNEAMNKKLQELFSHLSIKLDQNLPLTSSEALDKLADQVNKSTEEIFFSCDHAFAAFFETRSR